MLLSPPDKLVPPPHPDAHKGAPDVAIHGVLPPRAGRRRRCGDRYGRRNHDGRGRPYGPHVCTFLSAALERGGEMSKSRAGDWFASCVAASRTAPKTNPLRGGVRLLAPVSSATEGVTNVTVVKALARLDASGMGGDPIWSSRVRPR